MFSVKEAIGRPPAAWSEIKESSDTDCGCGCGGQCGDQKKKWLLIAAATLLLAGGIWLFFRSQMSNAEK